MYTSIRLTLQEKTVNKIVIKINSNSIQKPVTGNTVCGCVWADVISLTQAYSYRQKLNFCTRMLMSVHHSILVYSDIPKFVA